MPRTVQSARRRDPRGDWNALAFYETSPASMPDLHPDYAASGATTDERTHFKHTYDAWGRIKDSSTISGGSQPVLQRTYDALGRLVIWKEYQEGALVRTDENYYNIGRQQIIEQRNGSGQTGRMAVRRECNRR